ncbi:MarR family winged helix-turn-helix transcriptional regulator [Kutzneria buriramensis]|uniref:MarR family winged helix-turn-helix transcriptional regulator n=1 Tax=Kutzneria buriramensis TaxID=1045776 RepID=UPI00147764AB|nr:MarR family transcriptional regulator [Kutzneria buriramensis]
MSASTRLAEVSAEQCLPVQVFLHAARLLESELNRRLCDGVGVTYAQFQILAALACRPQRRLRMTDLAAAVGLSRSCLSHAVARMEDAGWVRRDTRDAGDGRAVDTTLTDLGLDMFAMANSVYARGVRELVLDYLTGDQLQDLRAASAALLPLPDAAAVATTARHFDLGQRRAAGHC